MSVPGNIPDEPPSRRRPSAWLQEKLLERRIVLVTGRLDDDLAAEAAVALMILDATDDEPIELHLDSSDGTLESAFVLIDTLDLLHATLRAHCRGQVGGPAIGIAAAADHRSAFPHTRFRLFQPTAQFSGTPDQIASHSRQQQELLWKFHARLAQLTGRPAEEIAEDMRRGQLDDLDVDGPRDRRPSGRLAQQGQEGLLHPAARRMPFDREALWTHSPGAG